MRKTDNYGCGLNIENIMEGEVNEDLFVYWTRLVVTTRFLDMDVMLASRCQVSIQGHINVCRERLLASP